jgi:regulatory protein
MDNNKDTNKSKQTKKQPKKISESYLRNSSLYYLQRHPASISHFLNVMERKMKRSLKAHPDQDLSAYTVFLKEILVPDLERAGLLNDTLYTKALTASLQRRGIPKRMISMRLAVKGVKADEEQLQEQTDFTAAHKFAKRKRLGPFSKQQRDIQKDLNSLARAGFSYETAMRILKSTPEELETAHEE